MEIITFILKYWIEIFFGILIGLFGYIYQRLKKYYSLIETTKNGVKVLLKVEIIRRYNEYKKNGEISMFDKEIISELYKEYGNLDGNGIISEIVKKINEIPLSIDGGD